MYWFKVKNKDFSWSCSSYLIFWFDVNGNSRENLNRYKYIKYKKGTQEIYMHDVWVVLIMSVLFNKTFFLKNHLHSKDLLKGFISTWSICFTGMGKPLEKESVHYSWSLPWSTQVPGALQRMWALKCPIWPIQLPLSSSPNGQLYSSGSHR